MHTMNRLLTLFLVLSLLTCRAVAQEGEAQPTPPAELADLLRERWQKENRRGVFIAVLPKEKPGNARNTAEAILPNTFAGLLAERESVSRSFGMVTSAADQRVRVYSTVLPPPRFDATGNPWQDRRNAVPQLLATLSGAQWREIASPQGLAYAGLSTEQKVIWEHSVPNPFVFDRSKLGYDGRETSKENRRELSEPERYQVRLRVKLVSYAAATLADKSGRMPVIFHKNQSDRALKGETFLHLKNTGAYERPQYSDDTMDMVYGQTVIRHEPARPKTLPADFEKKLTSVPISMVAPEGNKPLTVGVLLSRVETASGLKICADSAR
ncbi:MAG: hypothetical protein H7145_25215, partial [Akkermansiaceae bacterium]|nr:hypothetical protein [Armatimonadota bacterium]